MSPDKNQSFPTRLRFALHGLAHALGSERSLRFQATCFVLLLGTLAWLQPAPLWWAVLLLAGAGVLAAELFNTAIEHLVDHLHPEVHPRIRVVKDCAAAGVLLSVGGALAVAVAFAVHLLRGAH
jgi:diacylglycerol kinase (ATP)